MKKYVFTLIYQPGLGEEGNKVKTIDIYDKDEEPVAVFSSDASSTPWAAAMGVVKNLIYAEWEFCGRTPFYQPEEMGDDLYAISIPPTLRPTRGGSYYFLLSLRSKVIRFLEDIWAASQKIGGDPPHSKRYFTLEWNNTDAPDTIQLTFTHALPKYDGEDWNDRLRFPICHPRFGSGEIQVAYSGVGNKTYVQFIDKREKKEGKTKYHDAVVHFTTIKGEEVVFTMSRTPGYWELVPGGEKGLDLFLAQSGMRLHDLSYFLEANVRYVGEKCDMPVRFFHTLSSCDEVAFNDEVLLVSGDVEHREEERVKVALGMYEVRVIRDADGVNPVKLLVARESHSEDFFTIPPKTVEFDREVKVKAWKYFLIGEAHLSSRLETQEKEFYPYLLSRIDRRFTRPGICNYLRSGFAAALRPCATEREVKVNLFKATTGDKSGQVVAFDITL